ncbi:Uncharacterized protein PECH_003658 [Penicillium ucsense]|uniref:DUF4604 domain-containing protein n=1 Tax=Penicillium ucsense TaxID=2839758 RepID=A0A8J8W6D7_9EURO|nr:Uncharacterized protein PECM_001842 [Penicillium ucsense]KAF7737481.1 Uncharacterized protein PECH_003658 [Penicillium ucsense]
MSKNAKLAYEANEPAFLQKLRGHYGGNSGRLERPAARPRKLKDKNEDDDDAPVYVDETSNEVISKTEYEALVRGVSDEKPDNSCGTSEAGEQGERNVQSQSENQLSRQQKNLLEIGGPKKRKQARLVGDDEQSESAAEQAKLQALPSKPQGDKKAKKAKKIKLSFDDGE